MEILSIIEKAVKQGASDLHLSTGAHPTIRLHKKLKSLDHQTKMTEPQIQKFLKHAIPEHLHKRFNTKTALDFSFQLADLARFRLNAFKGLNGTNLALRILPLTIPTLETLDAPAQLKKLCALKKGLVLLTGPTGSGKSTTLAAMMNELNQTTQQHIITLEDPIEYIFTNEKSIIHQRQIGEHTESFSQGLKEALREDPDTILIGEIRDADTMRLALMAAETGHLVLSTLHTDSAAKTIARIVNMFPLNEQPLISTLLADSIEAIVSQVLLNKKSGGLTNVHEIMLANEAARNLIRENKSAQLFSMMQTSGEMGMCTMEQAINALRESEII